MSREDLFKLMGVGFYLVVLLAIGLVASRRMRDLRDYVVGGKRLGFFSVAFSARATGESGWLLLGLTGMAATAGVHAFWVVIGEVLGVAGAWMLMARRFKRLTDRYDSVTVPDYLESRFRDTGHLLRLVAAGALLVCVTIYVSAQIDATGQAFQDFLGWDYYAGALVGFAVVLLYTTGGGFLAVVWSDVFQGAMMVIGLVALPLAALWSAGGVGAVVDGLKRQDAALLALGGARGWSAEGVGATLAFLCIGLGFLGSPQVFVRFLALRSEREIRTGAAVAVLWTVLADSGAVIIGMVGRHLLMRDPGAILPPGEDVLPLLVARVMPVFVVGLYIAIVLAAIMSTVDSLLVVAASAAVRDWYQRVRRPDLPDDALVSRSRAATVAIALVALAVAMTVAGLHPQRKIFWFVLVGWSGIAATFCPTIILSLFWSRLTSRGALAAMITGLAGVPVFKFAAPLLPGAGPFFGALEELLPAFLLSGAVGVGVSLLDSTGARRLEEVGEELEAARGSPGVSPRGQAGRPS